MILNYSFIVTLGNKTFLVDMTPTSIIYHHRKALITLATGQYVKMKLKRYTYPITKNKFVLASLKSI